MRRGRRELSVDEEATEADSARDFMKAADGGKGAPLYTLFFSGKDLPLRQKSALEQAL
jgi:hypothetical protein